MLGVKMLNIAKFSNEKELYEQFRSRMINYKTVEMLCKEDTSKLSEAEILQKFEKIRKDVESKITFTNIPQQVSLGRNLINTLNPFKDENAVRRFDIKFDEEKCHYEMGKGFEIIRSPKGPSQAEAKDVSIAALEAAKRKLQDAHVSQDDVARPVADIEEAKQRLQAAKVESEGHNSGSATIKEAQEKVRGAVTRGFVDEEGRRKAEKSKKKDRAKD